MSCGIDNAGATFPTSLARVPQTL